MKGIWGTIEISNEAKWRPFCRSVALRRALRGTPVFHSIRRSIVTCATHCTPFLLLLTPGVMGHREGLSHTSSIFFFVSSPRNEITEIRFAVSSRPRNNRGRDRKAELRFWAQLDGVLKVTGRGTHRQRVFVATRDAGRTGLEWKAFRRRRLWKRLIQPRGETLGSMRPFLRLR